MRMRFHVGLVVVSALVGCGDGRAGPDYEVPFATLRGTISSSTVQTPAEVRAALLWHKNGSGDPSVAQEVRVRAQFPVGFELHVLSLPPEEAMGPAYGQIRIGPDGMPVPIGGIRESLGEIVVYEDSNGNGKLDVIPLDGPGSERFADRILGHGDHFVRYYEGTPTESLPGYTPGFQLAGYYSIPGPNGDLPAVRPVPFSTQISIALTGDPWLSPLHLCPFEGTLGYCYLAGQCVVPPGREFVCNDNGMPRRYLGCHESATICGAQVCSLVGEPPQGSPPPEGWPPCQPARYR